MIAHNTTNPATNTPISVLYSEYEDALSAMAIADELTLDLKQSFQAKKERDQQADRASYAVYRILSSRSKNESEKQTQKLLWEEYADVIVGAREGDIFHNLHLRLFSINS